MGWLVVGKKVVDLYKVSIAENLLTNASSSYDSNAVCAIGANGAGAADKAKRWPPLAKPETQTV